MQQTSSNARQVWATIAFQWFPFRHEKTMKGTHARGMIKSMIRHGKAWRKWKSGVLKTSLE